MTDWSGYPNGATPLSMMTVVRDEYFEPHAAIDLLNLETKCEAEVGRQITITEGFRTLATQQYLYNGWVNRLPGFNLAAVPGTSIHGDGQACDFGPAVDTYGSDDRAWMLDNGPAFGWYPTGDHFSPREAWHWEHPALSVVGPTITAPVINKIKEHPMNYVKGKSTQFVYEVYTDANGIARLRVAGWYEMNLAMMRPGVIIELEDATLEALGKECGYVFGQENPYPTVAVK